MARDLNQLMDDIRRSREVFVTPEGEVEERGEAEENARREQSTEGTARPRTRLKPEVFGVNAVTACHARGGRAA